MARYSFRKAMRRLGVGMLGAVAVGLGCGSAIAQDNGIVLDGTTNSVVSPFSTGSTDDVISGGFLNGPNLFHSFQEFNVREGRGAYFFTNPTNIENIFSRVTGNNASEILGTLGTFGNSTPDLWLINPNGILFGPNASLNVDGSFVASTANGILIDGTLPFLTPNLSENQDILEIDSSVLLFNTLSDAVIENQSQVSLATSSISLHGTREFRGLAVPNGESLILASPDIRMSGGGLNAFNGNIRLHSWGSVSFTDSATAQADNIFITTSQMSVEDGSQVLAQFIDPRIFSGVSIKDTEDAQTFVPFGIEELQKLPASEGGNLSITANAVEISGTDSSGQNSSRIGAGAIGILTTGGNVTIQTESLELQDGGQITSDYISVLEGNEGGGNISVAAETTTAIGGESAERSEQSGFFVGSGYRFRLATNGSVDITSDSVAILDGAQVSARLVPIETPDKSEPLSEGITINSTETTISGASRNGVSSTLSTNYTRSSNQVNPISVQTEVLSLAEGGQINSFLTTINANRITLEDDAAINDSKPIFSGVPEVSLTASEIEIRDDARISGDVKIDSNRLRLRENSTIGGTIDVSQIDSGNGSQPDIDIGGIIGPRLEVVGTINIDSDEVLLQENASISGNSVSISDSNEVLLQGNASISGDNSVFISDSDEVLLQDNASISGESISISVNRLDILNSGQVSASAEGLGNSGGTIKIIAEDAVSVIADSSSSKPASIAATAGSPGRGGNIDVETGSLAIRNGAQLSANINGGGTGGGINIIARDSVTVEGTSDNGSPSQISAESDLNGGEFGVLRSVRVNSQLPQDISSILNGRIAIFTQVTPGEIRSSGNSGLRGTNTITFSGDKSPTDKTIVISQVGTGQNTTNIVNFSDTLVPQEETSILSLLAGTAEQVLLLNASVPDDGALIVGQSFNPDFEGSITGGQLISSDDISEELRPLFLSTLESLLEFGLNDDPTNNGQLPTILEDIDEIRQSFLNGSGEFYVVASTGNEFRIKDDVYTDTTFSQIEPGDLFLIFAARAGGDINIETGDLTVRDGATISTTSRGAATGNAAASQLDITANSVLVENNATISAISETGSGGNISIRTSDMRLNNSTLTASAEKNATGGSITINAGNGTLRTNNGSILSSSDSVGGGNVTIAARTIRFDGDSDVQADVSGGSGDGGNINLSADYIIAFDDSDIFANAIGGSGGIITLNTPGFFGNGFTAASLNANPATLQGNNRADINATGVVNGVVTAPNVNSLENSLTSLPDTLIAPDQLIASSCIARANDGQGALVTTGGDGLANSPDAALSVPLSTGAVQAIAERQPNAEVLIDEPTGIYQLADGRLVMGKACL